MRLAIIWTIFRKEITESLRDRLTLIVVIGLPVLLYPLMIMGLSKLQESHAETEEEHVSRVAVWGDAPAPLLDWLRSTNKLMLTNVAGVPRDIEAGLVSGRFQPPDTKAASTNRAEANKARSTNPVFHAAHTVVMTNQVDAVLVVWPGVRDALANDGLGQLSICYDSVRSASQKAQDRLHDALADFRRHVVREREESHRLAKGFSEGLEIANVNVAPPKRRVGDWLGKLLPFVIIMLSATGALYASIDLTAGEKDRQTMQTLLCAPVHNLEIVGGKFLAVWCISLIASMANAASIGATIWRASASVASSSGGVFNLPPSTFVFAFVLLLPATFTISSFFIAIAMMARDAKDAGNFLGASLTFLMMPMAAVLMPGVNLNAWTSFVPLINLSLLIKAVFIGEARPDTIFLTLLSSLLYAGLSISLAARAFGREQLLLGGRASLAALLLPERKPGETPTPSIALTTFALVLVLAYYGSLLLEKRGIITNLLVTQYVFFLIPVTVLAVVMKFRLRETFSLRAPPWRGVVAAVLLGLSAWAAVGGIVIRLLPPPDSLVKALEKITLLGDNQSPLWLAWLVVALTPALCEELLFRGLVLSGLRRWGNGVALVVSSLLFAIAHASIYRLLPTFFLGLLLGYIVLRTGSIFCSMIIHTLNNGLAVTIARSPTLADTLHLKNATFVPWSLTIPAVVLMIVALWILKSRRTKQILR